MAQGPSSLDGPRRLETSKLKLPKDKEARLLGIEAEPPEPEPQPPGRVPAGPRSDPPEDSDWLKRSLRGY